MEMKELIFMQKALRLSKIFWILLFLFAFPTYSWAAETSVSVKKQETALYRDIFDQNVYYEGTNYFHLERLYRGIFRKKTRSANVNLYDEVPDSPFFTNRHSRNRLSPSELEEGFKENSGPDISGKLEVINGKFEGMHPGFFVRDSKGDRYLLKFDPMDFLELSTSAEVIASRFYHALGYNVPQYSLALISAAQLTPVEGAKIYDNSGFKKTLTPDKLEEYLLFLPQDLEGRYRASASKILEGENAGTFSLSGRRKDDPEDMIPHKDRREIRALRVFSSWLANYDLRESNTLTIVQANAQGKQSFKYYLIDFNTAFGSGTSDGKPPMTTYEYLFDYGEGAKAFLSLGLWEKPWQKKWRESGEKISGSPAIGYFDNRYFDPGKFKAQLPHFAFKDVTRADGLWAAKIIMAFTNEDIQALVKAGQFSDPKDLDTLSQILIERRDLIGRYWFAEANPLEGFDLSGNSLVFNDLAIDYGFETAENSIYFVQIFGKKGSKAKKIKSTQTNQVSIDLENSLSEFDGVDVLIRVTRKGGKPGPYVFVQISGGGIKRIVHED